MSDASPTPDPKAKAPKASDTTPLDKAQLNTSSYVVDLPMPEELQAMLPAGHYIVERFLGHGGMGAVYRGLQMPLSRPVAIKILRKGLGEKFDYEERFRREAYAMAALTHPNIVRVFDFGDAGPNYLFISMELVEGGDLFDFIHQGQMTPELALKMIPQICDGLQFAHEHGIVHRDIKPANIMLTSDDRVKIMDFGLAKNFDSKTSFMTQSGMGMGTADYAAPEQYTITKDLDHRADVYSLGVLMYQMLTGQLPRGMWKPPSTRVAIDPRLDQVVAKAMEPERNDRYQSVREIKEVIASIMTPQAAAYYSIRAASTTSMPDISTQAIAALAATAPLSLNKKRTSKLLWSLGTLWVTALAVGGLFFLKSTPETGAPETAKSISNILFAPDYEWSIPENLGLGVNGDSNEYGITITDDELVMILHSYRSGAGHLYECRRKTVHEPFTDVSIIAELETPASEVSPFITGDGLTLFYESSVGPGRQGNMDVYQTQRRDRNSPWDPPTNLGREINGPDYEGWPCLSRDGLTLVFSSDRPGGEGNRDLWRSRRPSLTEPFGKAENLGAGVNGAKHEISPVFTADNKFMFFVKEIPDSLPKPFVVPNTTGAWTANLLELPMKDWIQSPKLSADCKTLYFTSNNPHGHGAFDVWKTHRVRKQKPAP